MSSNRSDIVVFSKEDYNKALRLIGRENNANEGVTRDTA